MKKYKNNRVIILLVTTAIFICMAIPFFKVYAKCNDTEDVSATREHKILAITPYEIAIQKVQAELEIINEINDKEEWFMAYKKLVLRYRDLVDFSPTIYDRYTEEEIRLIQKTVETECYDQSFESKANVASVIFNRIKDGRFGKTVKEIITAKNQFAYGREKITESTVLAVEYAFQIEDTTNGCIAFRSDISPEMWRKWEYSFTDDAGHSFYREKEE